MFLLNVLSDDPSLMGLPQALGEAWGISTFSAGLLLSTIVLAGLLLAVAILNKGLLLTLIVSLGTSGFLIPIGWLPYWILLLEVLLLASVYGRRIQKSL